MACFLETLARFRPDLTLLVELNEIAGENDFVPLGAVPSAWLETRRIASAKVRGHYADVAASDWIALLRKRLATACLDLGFADFDAAVLQRSSPRRLTQSVSREVYARGFAGIVYPSRYGQELENWALFELFLLSDIRAFPIESADPDLALALELHGLRLARQRP